MAKMWPSNHRDFSRRFPGNPFTIHNLSSGDRRASGSDWSANHLQAFRVLQDQKYDVPIPEKYKEKAAKVVDGNKLLLDSLKSVTYEQLQTLSHRELRSETVFGSYFVALADVARGVRVPDGSPRLRKNIKVPERPDFRSGEGEGFSSSPPRASSPIPTHIPTTPTPISKTSKSIPPNSSPFTTDSTEYAPSQRDGIDFEDQLDRKKHEVVSANMAAQFISTVLDVYCSRSNENIGTEFFVGPTTLYLSSPTLDCTCQDDGAAWRRVRDPSTKAWMNDESTPLLFSLEVKSFYTQSDSSGMGITSDTTLAQQFCELLGSVMSQVKNQNYKALTDDQRRRFLVSVHQTDMMIIGCDFSLDYLEYVYSYEQPDHLPYVVLKRSRKYDLGNPEDRIDAAKAIVALDEYLKDIP
ncbi:hypothetical protein OCU04_004944 [Sclerotinia nivalis]|uniref:Uncharacterized protein n=1 Tax=Sclerotinia nivalis TaxID=352851 RepID=A0A9X0AN69_9HELO|nr:hypothetical protein OCU04_004944 [Sclerotinia nivalis]